MAALTRLKDYLRRLDELFSSFASTQIPDVGIQIDRTIEERKRKLYLAVILLGLLAVALAGLYHNEEYLFIRFAYPILMGMLLVWVGAFLWRRIPLCWIEWSVQTALSLFFLVNYVFVLQFPDSIATRSELNAVFWAMAFLVVSGYIMIHRMAALVLALGYTLLTMILGLLLLLPERYNLFMETLRIEFRLVMMALLAYILAKAKDDVILMQQELGHMDTLAHTDLLTGLPNRRMVSKVLAECLQQRLPVVLLLIDIDYFKSINDTYGHDVGDMVLKRVAHTLRLHTREEDLVSRWGGEEFLALIYKSQQAEALALAERMRSEIEKLHFDYFSLTISVGVTAMRQGESLEVLLKRVDLALYQAKAAGRNNVCWLA